MWWALGGVAAVIAVVMFYNAILVPAYLSTVDGCYPKAEAERILSENNAVQLGVTTYNAETKQVQIAVYYDSPDRRVLKHEQCHAAQFTAERHHNCDGKLNVGFFVDEVECKLAERLPVGIYERIYGELPQ